MSDKVYDYKALIEAYINANYKNYVHQDFYDYYKELFEKLTEVFGITLHHTDSQLRGGDSAQKANALMLFNATARRYVTIGTPWDGFLEGSHRLDEIYEKYGLRLLEMAKESEEIYLALLDDLFHIIYGQVETVVTSEMLRNNGFDDSQKPKMSDYDDYI